MGSHALALTHTTTVPAPRSCNCVFTGTLTGAGRQALGFAANLAAYWGVGLPLVWWLSGTRGVEGMWLAMALVSWLQAAVLGALIATFDWGAEAGRASARVRQGADSMRGGVGELGGGGGGDGVEGEGGPLLGGPAAAGVKSGDTRAVFPHHGPHDALIASPIGVD
ncbi:hypothetical protein FOA52_004005 [Chlamydomonas sp. UWO 241]|nr:hypothetical protein FOA52_004005 [Chlamydomonas sp. UWO 241]